MSNRTADHISVLTRTHDIDAELGRAIRLAAHRGRLTAAQMRAFVALLRQLPKRAT